MKIGFRKEALIGGQHDDNVYFTLNKPERGYQYSFGLMIYFRILHFKILQTLTGRPIVP